MKPRKQRAKVKATKEQPTILVDKAPITGQAITDFELRKRFQSLDPSFSILEKNDMTKVWADLLKHPDPKIKLDAAKYLTDRAYGRAADKVQISGDKEEPLMVQVVHIAAHHVLERRAESLADRAKMIDIIEESKRIH